MDQYHLKITHRIVWDIGLINDDSNRWIGYCESLDLCVGARSRKALNVAIRQAMDLLTTSLGERGILETWLTERGIAFERVPSSDGVLHYESVLQEAEDIVARVQQGSADTMARALATA